MGETTNTAARESAISTPTPGPWALHGANVVTRAGAFHRIADVLEPADARLIAAAPEMLEALKDWLYFAEECLHEFDGEICTSKRLCARCEPTGCINLKIINARAAIAKATGTASRTDDAHRSAKRE